MTFSFTTDAGPLQYLQGRTFQVEQVDFVREYFPFYDCNFPGKVIE